MTRIHTHSISLGLIGSGVIAWAFAGRPLTANHDLKVPLNPLGINGGPYGEVLAMAMQGPINTYSEVGISGQAHNHAAGKKCDGHGHADGEKCSGHDDHAAGAQSTPAPARSFEQFLVSLGEAAETRTNPYSAGEALKRHLRRQAEDKLRFAYKLDPSHYGNYNALHFFLTEPAVSTRPQLTRAAAKLAEDTIQYSLKQENDPRAALTAAAAATNILHLMFEDYKSEAPKFSIPQMRHFLSVLDYSLARYETIAKQWDKSKNWDLLSPQRIMECDDRFHFISKIRQTSEQTIIRFESKFQHQAGGEFQSLKVLRS